MGISYSLFTPLFFIMIKTLLWTSLFWILVISWAYGFVRYVADDSIKDLVLPRWENLDTLWTLSNTAELDALREWNNYLIQQIDKLSEQIGDMKTDTSSTNYNTNDTSSNTNITNDTDTSTDTTATNQESTINLYYFNEEVDQQLPARNQLNTSSIQAVQRTITTDNSMEAQITAAINLLLEWDLTAEERRNWFVSDFPSGLVLEKVEFNEYQIAVLTFSQEDDSINWSARVILLRDAIEKTVEQFEWIRSTLILPNEILQS